MASQIIGKIAVRVYPDTSKFYLQAKRELEVLAKRLDQDVRLRPDVDQAAKAHAKKQLASLDADAAVKPVLDKFAKAVVDKQLSEFDRKVKVRVDEASLDRVNKVIKRRLDDSFIHAVPTHDPKIVELGKRRFSTLARAAKNYAAEVKGIERNLKEHNKRLRETGKRANVALRPLKSFIKEGETRIDTWGREVKEAGQLVNTLGKVNKWYGDTFYLVRQGEKRFSELADAVHNVERNTKLASRGFKDLEGNMRSTLETQKRLRRERSLPYRLDRQLELAMRDWGRFRGKDPKIEYHVDLAEKSVQNVKRKIRDLKEDKKITFNADLDHGAASAKLALVTRPRFVKIKAIVDKKSWDLAWKTVTRMTGLRAGWHYMDRFWDFFKDIDKHVPLIGLIANGITGLTAVITHSTGAVLTFIGSLGRIAGLVNVLPGFLGAAAFGFTTFFLSMKHAGDYVGDLRENFTALRVTMTDSFWRGAEQPLRRVVEDLLPRLDARVGQSADYMGKVFGAAILQLNESLSDSQIKELFDNLDLSLRRMTPGIEAMIDALTVMGVKGSEYLVRFSDWFTEGMQNWRDSMRKAVEDGSFDRWLEQAIDSSKLLGRALKGTYDVFAGLTRAARKGGHAGLETYVRSMERAARYLNSVSGSNRWAHFFRNARLAAESLYRGIGDLFHAFGEIDVVIGRVLQTSGRTLEKFFRTIADIIRQPAFTTGLEAMFSGLEKGMTTINEHAPAFAEFFGSLGRIIGTFAEILGPVAATLVEALAPALAELADKFAELQPRISALIEGPVLSALEKFFNIIAGHPMAVLTMAGAIGGFSLALKGLRFLNDVRSWVQGLSGLATGVRDMGKSLAGGVSGKLGSFARSLTKLGLAAGAAVGVARIIGSIDQAINNNKRTLSEWKQQISSSGSAIDMFAGTTMGWWKLRDEIVKTKDDFQELLDTADRRRGTWQRAGSEWIAKVLKAHDVNTLFIQQLRSIDEALVSMGFEASIDGFQTLAASTDGSQQSLNALLEEMPLLKEQLIDYASSLGLPIDNTTLLKLATGELQIQYDEFGNAVAVTSDGVVTKFDEMGRAAEVAGEQVASSLEIAGDELDPYKDKVQTSMDLIRAIFGEAVDLPQPLLDGYAVMEAETDRALQETEAITAERMGTLLQLMSDSGFQSTEAWARATDGIPEATVQALVANRDEIVAGLEIARVAAEAGSEGVRGAVTGMFDGASTEIAGQIGDVCLVVEEGASQIQSTIDTSGQNMNVSWGKEFSNLARITQSKMSDVNRQTKTALDKTAADVDSAGKNVAAKWESGLKSARTKGGTQARSASTVVKDTMRATSNGVYSSGYAVGSSFASGLRDSVPVVESASAAVAAASRAYFPNSPAKRGAFSGRGWVVHAGRKTAKAFARGLREASSYAEREAQRLADGAQAAFDSVNPEFMGGPHSPTGFMAGSGVGPAGLRKGQPVNLVLRTSQGDVKLAVAAEIEEVLGASGSARAEFGVY